MGDEFQSKAIHSRCKWRFQRWLSSVLPEIRFTGPALRFLRLQKLVTLTLSIVLCQTPFFPLNADTAAKTGSKHPGCSLASLFTTLSIDHTRCLTLTLPPHSNVRHMVAYRHYLFLLSDQSLMVRDDRFNGTVKPLITFESKGLIRTGGEIQVLPLKNRVLVGSPKGLYSISDRALDEDKPPEVTLLIKGKVALLNSRKETMYALIDHHFYGSTSTAPQAWKKLGYLAGTLLSSVTNEAELLLGTSNGLHGFDFRLRTLHHYSIITSQVYRMMPVERGTLIVSEEGIFFKESDPKLTPKRFYIDPGYVYDMALWKGAMWLACDRGLLRAATHSDTFELLETLPPRCSIVRPWKKHLFVTAGQTLYQFDPVKGENFSVHRYIPFPHPIKQLHIITEEFVLVQTKEATFGIDTRHHRRISIPNLDPSPILFLKQTTDGYILGTQQGLYRITPQNLTAPLKCVIQTSEPIKAYCLKDKWIWFSTTNRLIGIESQKW